MESRNTKVWTPRNNFHVCLASVYVFTVTVSLALPLDQPFLSIWNTPSGGCDKYGLNLTYFDIIINQGGAFSGNESIIYYSFGDFPHYEGNVTVNGGIPQLGNITLNNEAMAELIKKSIPNKEFNGIAVLDWETWRALYDWNFDSLKLYQEKSNELVKKQHPDWNSSAVIAEARKEFDLGAKKFMEGTLNLSRSLRPGGYWGYYQYPLCVPVDNGSMCSKSMQQENDQAAYLYARSTGYFPRIYIGGHLASDPYVKAVLNESLRLRALYGEPWTEILPYTRYRFNETEFYSKQDLDVTVKQSADAGAGGIVFWGSSAYVRTKEDCLNLIHHVDTLLGPYVVNLTNFVKACSRSLCSNHGRCVLKDTSTINYRKLEEREPGDYEGYICQCYYQWTGEHCEKPSDQDLDVTVKQSADAGAGGVVFWGSHAYVQTKEQCLNLINHVDTLLAPYVVNLTNFVKACSRSLCSNHGRCVLKDASAINYRKLEEREPGDYKGYICQCYYQWTGEHCEKPSDVGTDSSSRICGFSGFLIYMINTILYYFSFLRTLLFFFIN